MNHWEVYDQLLDQVSQSLDDGRREMLLRVEGLRCRACVRRLERALPPGPVEAQADVASGSCLLNWDPACLPLSAVLQAIDDAGFRPVVLADDASRRTARDERRAALGRIGVALLFGMQVMMLASGEYLGEIDPALRPLLRHAQWLLATPVVLYAGWPFLRQGFGALRALSPTMDTPVAIAIATAYLASAINTLLDTGAVYFDSAAMFVLLLSLARFVEAHGRTRAAARLRLLAGAQPLAALRREQGQLLEVPTSALRAGDLLVVPPGAAVAADGELICAAAALDESLITGEAVPRERRQGEAVCAGSVNAGPLPLELRVSSAGARSVLSQLTRLMQRAQLAKPRAQQLADRIAGRFVGVVLLLAAATGAYWIGSGAELGMSLQTMLAVLVVTCPCALSLATPMAHAAASTRLAREGLMLVQVDALHAATRVDTVCLDKTGTLTTRRMRLQEVRTLSTLDADACCAVASGMEAGLNHPIAQAFRDACPQAPAIPSRLDGVQGLRAETTDGVWHLSRLPSTTTDCAGAIHALRWLELSRDGRPVARFALQEQLRPGAGAMVRRLREMGLEVVLFSGDGQQAASGVAELAGIAGAQGNLLPEQKLRRLAALQAAGHRVLAVGDGINDGPMLAAADVSIGLADGAALAQAHGDAILIQDNLEAIAGLLQVARQARRIVVQNIGWAIAYNLTLLPLAMSGALPPWLAALGMGGSSLLVTLNAQRLLGAVGSGHLPVPLVRAAQT